jgi:hypothetical protein
MPIHQTKLTMANPHASGIWTPHMPNADRKENHDAEHQYGHEEE